MAQVLELLAKQMPAAQAPLQPQLPYPPSPRGVQEGWEEVSQPVQEEDMLFIATSVEGAAFSSDMQVGETRAEEEPGFEVPWTPPAKPRQSVFRTQAMAPRPQQFPAFPDFMEEVHFSWDHPALSPSVLKHAAPLASLEGTDKLSLAGFPLVDSTIVALVKAPSATQLSNTASVLTAYLDSVLREAPLPELVAMELHLLSSTLLQISDIQGQALGRSLASLIVAHRQLWLSQARVPDVDKTTLLDAPISPGHTFGPAVEEILQKSHRVHDSSQQMAALLPPCSSAWGRWSRWQASQTRTVTRTVPVPTALLGDPRHRLQACTSAANNRAQPAGRGNAGLLTVVSCSRQYEDSEDTPVIQTAGRSIPGDSYTITAAAVSDQGQYCCRGQRKSRSSSSQLSNPVSVTVSEGHPQAFLTLQPAWSQIFSGETVTLSCEVEGGSAGWRFKQYRAGREEAGCSNQYSSRYGYSCTISKALHSHSGVYWCESASGQERSNAVNLTVSYGRVILQTPPQPVIEGDSLTLRCLIRDGYKATRVIFYKYNRELQSWAGKELSVDHVSKSDEGFYKCKAWWWWDSSPYSGDSAEVRVSVRELPQTTLTLEPPFPEIFTWETVTLRCGVEGVLLSGNISAGKPKPALTREPAGEIFEGDTVTLSCVVEGGSGGWRYLWYKDRQGAPVYQTDSSSGTGAGYTISAAALNHSGEYWCGAGRGRNTSYSQYSEGVKIQVSELFSTPTLTVLPGASVWEGEAVTLQCGAHINKQGTQLQYRYSKDNGTVRGAGSQDQHSIPAAGLRDTGRYQCEVEAAGTGLKKRSASVSLTVRALFSRVTLTASPGATVKEGEALNLTCEAAVNKTPRPELHYTIVRDGEPVTNSTDSALYSIASTEKSHTGSYTCAVESQGVKKSSQELHIEVQKSCSWIIAALSVSLVVIVIAVTLLLFYRYKTKGFLFIADKSRRPADQTPAQPSRGTELSVLGQEPGNSTASNLEIVYAEVKPNQQNKVGYLSIL
ncbi:UNVERIFIED_CONTAM: hypothetical protein FKN15_046174 [Acipenser sinensis]